MKRPELHWDESSAGSPYMTRREAARYLRCSVETVDRRAIQHAWSYARDGIRVLFLREDVMKTPITGFRRIRTPKTETLSLAQ